MIRLAAEIGEDEVLIYQVPGRCRNCQTTQQIEEEYGTPLRVLVYDVNCRPKGGYKCLNCGVDAVEHEPRQMPEIGGAGHGVIL